MLRSLVPKFSFAHRPSIKFTHMKNQPLVTLTCRDALNLAMDEELTRDESVFLIGILYNNNNKGEEVGEY